MKGKEVGEDRSQRGSVANGFVFIRGIRFLFNSQLRMNLFQARTIGKGNVADNPKTVGKDGEFIGIAEMPVDVHLFCIRAGAQVERKFIIKRKENPVKSRVWQFNNCLIKSIIRRN